MVAVLFAGPTLAGTDMTPPEGFVLRPPAGQGDIYRATERLRPRAIGLVDGVFEGVPSVWHKEILWAMASGVALYGSASMGALRAAELSAFGMIGVGRIFEAYRDGAIEADDEVALLHGPRETGFLPLTEPLVNVRATCEAAEAAGVLARDEAQAVLAAARSIFYKDRTWRAIVARCRAPARSRDRLNALEAWLSLGRVDQKRLDAEAMIGRMLADLERPNAGVPDLEFEPTFLWERAVAGWTRAPAPPEAEDGSAEAVLDELRLTPERYLALKLRAAHRMQAVRAAQAQGLSPGRSDWLAALKRHREARRLPRGSDLDRWLGEQRLERGEYERLIDEEALAGIAAEDPDLRRHMLALLALDGLHRALTERSAAKRAALAEGAGERGRVPPPVLLDWFFRTRLGRAVPEDIDGFARDLGLTSRDAFHALLAAEHAYAARDDEARAR
jgi:hypothetical protein